MLKKVLKMDGIAVLSKIKQKEIKGGIDFPEHLGGDGGGGSGLCSDVCYSDSDCGYQQECFVGTCYGEDTNMCRNKSGF